MVPYVSWTLMQLPFKEWKNFRLPCLLFFFFTFYFILHFKIKSSDSSAEVCHVQVLWFWKSKIKWWFVQNRFHDIITVPCFILFDTFFLLNFAWLEKVCTFKKVPGRVNCISFLYKYWVTYMQVFYLVNVRWIIETRSAFN